MNIKICRLNFYFLFIFRGLFHCSVVFELLEVQLDALQGVGEVSLLHLNSLLFDPEQEGGAVCLEVRLLLLNILDFQDYVSYSLTTSSASFHLEEGVVIRGHVPRTL